MQADLIQALSIAVALAVFVVIAALTVEILEEKLDPAYIEYALLTLLTPAAAAFILMTVGNLEAAQMTALVSFYATIGMVLGIVAGVIRSMVRRV